MPDFNVRSDSVNVELIMEQIRERIREKRGVDYTEQQIRDLAAVKLEKFLDPTGVRAARAAELRLRGCDAVRVAPRPDSVDPQAAAAAPQAAVQSEPADSGIAHPVEAEHDERRA